MNANCLQLCLLKSSKRPIYDNYDFPMLYLSWSLASIHKEGKPETMSPCAHGLMA